MNIKSCVEYTVYAQSLCMRTRAFVQIFVCAFICFSVKCTSNSSFVSGWSLCGTIKRCTLGSSPYTKCVLTNWPLRVFFLEWTLNILRICLIKPMFKQMNGSGWRVQLQLRQLQSLSDFTYKSKSQKLQLTPLYVKSKPQNNVCIEEIRKMYFQNTYATWNVGKPSRWLKQTSISTLIKLIILC